MKGVFVILDGVADENCPSLGGKTPLEMAKTPNLDLIAKKSRLDFCFTQKEGIIPESSGAIVSLLGYDPIFVPRGPIEANGLGIKLQNGDLALRCNFGTLDNLRDLNVLDRRAGRTLTTEEARILAKAINEKVKLPFKFEFYPSIQHRGVLVIKGGFSDNISNVDPEYNLHANKKNIQFGTQGKLPFAKSLDDEEDSEFAAEIVNNFVRQSFEVLDKHPINITRIKKGLHSANVILCRDAGDKPIKLDKLPGKWMALGYMPLEIGISRAVGMDVYKFKYPKLKRSDIYENLYEGLDEAIKNAKKMLSLNKNKYDYFYIHIKETDIPGHDNKPLDKIKMIEIIDKEFFSFLKDFAKDAKLIITADHTTSCTKKMHSSAPVPVLIYPCEGESSKRFTEKEGLKGKKLVGRTLLKNNFFN